MSAHGLERFGICLLRFSALQADRSEKNKTGNSNKQSCLNISSTINGPFDLALGHRLSECRLHVNKKVLTFKMKFIY